MRHAKMLYGLGKKMCVECDVESLKVAFVMREVERSKSSVRRSKTLVPFDFMVTSCLIDRLGRMGL